MANKNPVITLNGGEVSPLLYGRSDLNKYRSWQKKLDNFIVEPQGALKRRLGTFIQSRIGDVDDFTDSIIEPWLINRSNFFQMAFVDSEIRFFNPEGIQVFTLAIPYVPADFDQLYFRQIYDTMYITHPDYAVQVLTRTDQFVWTIEDAQIDGGAYANANFDTSSTVSVALGVSPEVTITASDAIFTDTDVGRIFRINHSGTNADSGSYAATTSSTPLPASGTTVTLETGGTWDGTVALELSVDNQVTWQTIGTAISKNNANAIITRDIDDFGAFVRITFTRTAGTLEWTLVSEGILYNNYEITGYTSDMIATADVIAGFFEVITDSWEWALGAFSETTGYPTCVEIFDERLFLAGVASYPADIYTSQTNRWTNFQSGVLATSPFTFTLNNDVRNRVRWFIVDQQLVCGTDNAEFTIGSRNPNEGISVANITVANQKQYGSDPIQPIRADSTSYFVEAGGRRIRSLNYLFERDSYMSDDMSILAPHLTQDYKIAKIAFTRTPDKIVWALREDGTLLTFTTDKEQNVGAWAKHPLLKNTQTDETKEWITEQIGTVIDIDSVLTEDGDVLGLIIQRQDGVYYETINQNNDCFDAQIVFNGINQDDVLALPGAEDFTYWDQAFIEKEVPFQGLGSFLRLDITVADLVVKYDGEVQILGEDFAQVREDLLYWLPNAPDETLITVDDFETPVSPANYYTVKALDCFVLEIKALSPIFTVTIKSLGTPLVIDDEYFAMSGAEQFLIIEPGTTDPDDITVEVEFLAETNLLNDDNNPVLNDSEENILIDVGAPTEVLSTDQYSVTTPIVLISIYTAPTATAYFGLPIYSTAELVDMYNSPDIGGGQGSTRRDVESDVFVVESVNFDYTSNAGLEDRTLWNIAKFIAQEPVMNEKIPEYTGKVKVQTVNGYSTEANIGIRSKSPYCLIVAQIAPYGSKQSSRGSN